MQPKVSIITPLYNAENYISDTIRSVQLQVEPSWEMILIDDCSNDGSVDIVKKFCENDERIRLIQLSVNSGAAVARNKALESASGRYVAFLDSDDLWFPEKLSAQIEFMENNKVALSYTSYEVILENGERTGAVSSAPESVSYVDMLKYNRIGCLTVMYDTQRLGKIFMPNIRKRQDYALWLNILRETGSARGISQVLASYRQREGSISSKKYDLIRYHWHVFRELESLPLAKSLYYLAWNVAGRLIIK